MSRLLGIAAPSGSVQVRFGVLGPIEASVDGRALDLGGPKPRLVLALLLLDPSRTVPADRLIEALWEDDRPADPRAALQVKVSGLRRTLEATGVAIDYGNGGYAIRVEPDAIDAHRFSELVGNGSRMVPVDPQRAATILRDALGLWRGRPFGDLADEPALAPEVARLEETRLRALERRIEADLSLGEHERTIEELRQLTSQHPLREGLWQQLMVALYRDGRQADALAAYDRAAGVLRDELGLDPAPPLRELHARVLRQDASLDARPQSFPGGERAKRSVRGYSLLEPVGPGRLGEIHRARQAGSEQLVTIEVASGELVDTPAFIQAFGVVAGRVSQLEHPHLAALEDSWREPGEACLVSQYVAGETLQSARGEGGWRPERVLNLISGLGGALDHAHRAGVTARDLSLRDIVVDRDGRAVLTGLASIALHEAVEGGVVDAGTPTSPDRSGRARPDVLRLARIAFHLLTGHPAGVAATVPRRPGTTGTAPQLPPLGDLRPDLPAAVGAVLVDAVSAEMGGFGSAVEFAEALRVAASSDAVGASPAAEVRNPFKGLRAFREGDAGDYFGREELLGRLRRRLDTDSFVLVGPSGSGKSSLVHAGLVPWLRSDGWFISRMQPGEWPMAELERALTEVATCDAQEVARALESGDDGLLRAVEAALETDGSSLLLFIDQFEELYAVARREDREAFLSRLAACLDDHEGRARVVLTVRADFYDELLVDPTIGAWVADHTVALSPLPPEEVEAAIAGPAARVGVGVEPRVVAAITDRIAGRPGSLPLLQFTLTELFSAREGGRITLDTYEEIGGVSGALVGRAERLYQQLDEAERGVCRQVFLRLVTVADGSTETRRRVLRAELVGVGDGETVEEILEAFGRHRLLTFDRDHFTRLPTVEIAHEALTREWGRLRGWIDGAREDIVLHRRLRAAADEWHLHDRDPSYLLRGSRLDEVQRWSTQSALVLTEAERGYVDASVRARAEREAAARAREARERQLEERARRRLRLVAAVSVVAAVGAVALSVVAFRERERARSQQVVAEQQGRVAEARAFAAASVAELDTDPQDSLRSALRAVEVTRAVDGTVLPEAESALHRAIAASRMIDRFSGVGGHLALSPDGRLLVTEGPEETGLIDVRDAGTGRSIHAFVGHDRSIGDRPPDLNSVAFGPDGELLATAGDDGTLRVWDRVWETGEERPMLVVDGDRVGEVWGPSFSPDGRLVAAAWEREGVVRVVDLGTGEVTLEVDRLAAPIAVRFSPDGQRLAVARAGQAGQAYVLDAVTGDRVHTLPGGDGRGLAWSPDGSLLLTTAVDGTARLWNADDGARRTAVFDHAAEIASVAWSPDSRRFATGSIDGTVGVWRLAEGGARRELELGAATKGFQGLSFARDGTRLIAGEEGDEDAINVTVWDVTDGATAEVANLPGAEAGPTWVDYHPTREHVAVSTPGGGVSVWELEGRGAAQGTQLAGGEALTGVREIAVSPDGTLAATPTDPTLRVWNLDTGQEVFDVDHRRSVGAAAWSPDADVVASGDIGGTVRVTRRSGESLATLEADDRAPSWRVERVAFSPDGEVLAVAGGTPAQPDSFHVELWDWEEGQLVEVLDTEQFNAVSLAFHPAGGLLAVGGGGGIEVFDVVTGERSMRLGSTSRAGVLAIAWGPDGTRVAAGRTDGTIRLWDPESGRELLELRGHGGMVSSLAFNADGSRLVSGDWNGQARVWALGIDELIDIAADELVERRPG